MRAFAAAVEAGAPGKLALVGNGPLADAVNAEIAHRGLDERARLFPFRPGRTREYLRAFDLFVLGSRWEALPISMLEAMSCGVAELAQTRFARERMVGDVEALYLRLLDEQP